MIQSYMMIFMFWVVLTALMMPFAAQAEEIVSFDVEIGVEQDASIDVVEVITYDFDEAKRHGIFRDIPVHYTTDKGNKRSITLSDVRVENAEGNTRTFVIEKNGQNKRIKIGDASRFVGGTQIYKISYTVGGALNYFDTHDELYWNVTGNEWPVAIGRASARVRTPGITETACFRGSPGSVTACSEQKASGNTVTFREGALSEGEGLTIVLGIPKSLITEPTIGDRILAFLRDNFVRVTLPLLFIGILFRHWWKNGRDPRGTGTVVPWFQAPDDLKPSEIGILIDERFDKKDLVALIIDLAIRGHLTIELLDDEGLFGWGKDYQFSQKKSDDQLEGFEVYFMEKFFDGKTHVKLSEKKQKFHAAFTTIGEKVYDRLVPQYFESHPKAANNKYTFFGSVFLFGGHALGMFSQNIFLIIVAWVGGLFLIMGYGKLMIRKTRKGVQTYEHVKGMKMYLSTAEQHTLAFHNDPEKMAVRMGNAPTKTFAEFERMLPYATVLGVMGAWSEQFEGLVEKKPEWFRGGATGTFSPTGFGADLSRMSIAASSALAAPKSSASSGGSGFSGGSSGGGFGGGGGGSW